MISKYSGGWKVDFYPEGETGPRIRKRGFRTRIDALAFIRNYGKKPARTRDRLSDLVQHWYDHHGHTLKESKYRLSRTLAVCERLGDPIASDFQADDWTEYRRMRLEEVSAETVNHEQRYLSAVLAEMVRRKRIRENPLAHVKQMRTPQSELTFLTLDQCRQLLNECREGRNPHVWAVAAICLATGSRWGEAEKLTHSGLVNGKVVFRETKNGKTRAIPIPADLEKVIREVALPGPGRMFVNCRSAFRAAYGRCGFQTPQQLTHILRHTFASHFMMNGGDLLTLQRILGHGTINMTMRYAHLAPNHLEAVGRYSPFAQLGV